MKLSIEEFKQLIDLTNKPIKVEIDKSQTSITIPVKCRKGTDVPTRLLKIDDQTIGALGIYDIHGIKVWVVKE